MSGSRIPIDVPTQIVKLAELAGEKPNEFQHYVLTSEASVGVGTPNNLLTFEIPDHMALVLTALDIESIPSMFDPDLAGANGVPVDWRSVLSINPYALNFLLLNGSTVIQLLVDDKPKYPDSTYQIMNAGVLFTIIGAKLEIRIGSGAPVGKTLLLKIRANTYICRDVVAQKLQDYETQVFAMGIAIGP